MSRNTPRVCFGKRSSRVKSKNPFREMKTPVRLSKWDKELKRKIGEPVWETELGGKRICVNACIVLGISYNVLTLHVFHHNYFRLPSPTVKYRMPNKCVRPRIGDTITVNVSPFERTIDEQKIGFKYCTLRHLPEPVAQQYEVVLRLVSEVCIKDTFRVGGIAQIVIDYCAQPPYVQRDEWYEFWLIVLRDRYKCLKCKKKKAKKRGFQ